MEGDAGQRPTLKRRLIVCCDGTWNQPYQPNNPTNVVKMARAIRSDAGGVPQIVYYDQGIGTGNAVDRLLGGTFGVGLSQNVTDAYLFLVNNYVEGTDIFLFGFSRGAYTVRRLAGMIGLVGLLNKTDMKRYPTAYRMYLKGKRRDSETSDEFEKRIDRTLQLKCPRARPKIKCLGVWDTVGALGIPFSIARSLNRRFYAFHDQHLGPHVEAAYQALAIDEQRRPFWPSLWKPSGRKRGQTAAPPPDPRAASGKIVQVWFPGAHSNVGGGYPDSGLSDYAFVWMVNRAKDEGLEVDQTYVDRVEAQTKYEIYNSRTIKYWLWRPATRRIWSDWPQTETLHWSAIDRFYTTPPGKFEPPEYRSPALSALEQRLRKSNKSLDDLVWRKDPIGRAYNRAAVIASPPESQQA